MTVIVNQQVVDAWLKKNKRGAVEKLAVKAGVSPSLIRNLRKGTPPAKADFRWQIAKALDVPEPDLFQVKTA